MPAAAQRNAGSRSNTQNQESDSLKKARRQVTDSLNFIRSYKQSKHYRDSVETARQQRVQDQKASQAAAAEALAAQRKKTADSIMAYRRRHSDSIRLYNDSIRTAQQRQIEQTKLERKRVSDSLAVIRAYKASKHYKDSVTNARETRKIALAKARKQTSDSLKAFQKARTDSTLAVRKLYNDSLKTALEAAKAIRTQQLDSMKAVRAARADSLGKVREARAALRKQKAEEKEKEKKEKSKLALELKIKKKQEKYTNEDMRKKKWTLPRKVMQNTFTRYNYYFNANKKMEEAIENMVRSNIDNYDSLIALFPFDPDRDSTKLLSDMDTIIHKASVGIQIHDPRAKWQDNLYLLVGQAYYYKGDYQNAGASFKQIVAQAEQAKKDEAKKKTPSKEDKNKPTTYSEAEKTGIAGMLEHKSSKNEAMLWLSRVLTQTGKEGQAQTLLDMLRNDAQFPERLDGRLALEQAFIELSRRDDAKAAQSLTIVSTDKDLPKWLRLRANYLNGQLMQQQLHYIESDQYFREVLNLNPNLEMEFYARKNLVANSINYGSNTLNAANMLDKMAADGKFRPYYDQIYFAMGKAALKNKQGDKALESFRKSVSLSQNNKKQKGLSFAAMGDEYYARSDYNNAKRSYDSAAMLLTIAQDPVYSIARQRALALDRVAIPGNEVKEQDSLIRLASLSEKEQRQAIREYIKALERKMRDSAYRAQLEPANNNNAGGSFGNQGTQSWYFANPNLMRQGENEFKQKWGPRTLKDNWRRSGSSSSGDFAASGSESGQESEQANLPDEDSLYAAIPHSPEQLQKANDRLSEGLFALGKAYYTHLEDYGKSSATFDTLDKRFPTHNHQAEVLYTRYLMSLRQNQPSVATQYNNQLQSRYPDSEWAKLLKGAAAATEIDPFANVSNMPKETVSNFYDETYGLLIQRQYKDVLRRVNEADELYKNQGNFRKKFNLMKAIAIAGNGNYPEADTMLQQFISSNPGDSLSHWATTVLEYIRKNPQSNTQVNNSLQPQANANTANVSGGLEYDYKPAAPHYVIFSAQQDAKFSGFRSGLSDYNLMKQGNEHISVTMSTLDAGRSLVVCKEFPNAAAAKKYLNEIRGVSLLFREYKAGEYDLLLISADNFPRLFVKKDYGAYKIFYSKNYK